jgi:acyl carrier protein
VQIKEIVRQAIVDHGRLSVPVDTLSDDADLFNAGLTSHAAVELVFSLEDTLGVEIPDHLIEREIIGCIGALTAALEGLLSESVA